MDSYPERSHNVYYVYDIMMIIPSDNLHLFVKDI